jgi:flavin reductase (DIM6/NTAB) family NADH-FMN oxidoreductase RutF
MKVVAELATKLSQGLRRHARAVTVISCQYDGERYAMTATAMCEVSLDPPSLLICVNRSSRLFSVLERGADFCVNILHRSHEDLSNLCAGKARGEDRFNFGDWSTDEAGVPFLTDAQTNIICRNAAHLDHGTHGVFIGDVSDVLVHGPVDPLIYVDGAYAAVLRPQ